MIAITLVLTGMFSLGFGRSYIRNYNVNKEIAQLESDQQNLEHERSELSALLKRIQSTAYAEEQAREQFGLRMPGEKAAVIQREEVSGEQKLLQNKKQLSNPMRWWLRFFEHEKPKT